MLELRIGRHTYVITSKDEFMSKGSFIQLMTQSKERGHWGYTSDPVLSKRAEKEIAGFKRIECAHNYGDLVVIFRLELSDD